MTGLARGIRRWFLVHFFCRHVFRRTPESEPWYRCAKCAGVLRYNLVDHYVTMG